jgi:hypothetical protein
MQHYSSQAFTDIGKPAGGASIAVKLAGTNTNATIYLDDGITVKSNPFITNNLGLFDFYAASGKYDITISGTQITSYTLTNQVIYDPFESNIGDTGVVNNGTVPMNSAGIGGFIGVQIWPAPLGGGGFVNSIVPVANQVRVYQFILPFAVTIGKVSISVVFNNAGTADVGIYSVAGVRLVYTNGGFNTGLGVNLTANIVGGTVILPAGFYYLAQTATTTVAQTDVLALSLSVGENLNGNRTGIAANAANSGVLPATLGTITNDVTQPPIAAYFER